MAEDLRFTTIAKKFLALYRSRVVTKFRDASDGSRFQALLRSNQFARQLQGMAQNLCRRYENDMWQAHVLDTIDLDTIYSNVDSTEGNEDDYTDRLVKELLRYFKNDFFKWCDKPECITCGSSQDQYHAGISQPTSEEAQYDCGTVEIFKCQKCGSLTRFPRYNDPLKLLETRKGRCGEWCNLFLLFLKSFGIESRYIWNREDHVWCEFYSKNLKRWVHLDCCEQSFDQPYIYSINWNKKMSYVVAFGRDGVVDVSKRYILKNELPRDQINEDDLQFVLNFITKHLRFKLTDEEVYQLACRDEQERLEWISSTGQETKTGSSPHGRESGSTAWKKSRGEDGNT